MDSSIDFRPLASDDARQLAPLLSDYVQALLRGAPTPPDQLYATRLLADKATELLGAFVDDTLVGFLMYHDLPEPITGKRAGQVDHVFVHHTHRGKGIAKAMVDVLADQAESRGWTRLRLNSPRASELGNRVFSSVAAPADWNSYVLFF